MFIFNIQVQNPDNPQILAILIQTNMNKKSDRSFEVNVARERSLMYNIYLW